MPEIDPSDGNIIAHYVKASDGARLAAIDAAEAALPAGSADPSRERVDSLRMMFEVLPTEKETFTEIVARENGKSWGDAMAEAGYTAEFFRWFSGEAVRILIGNTDKPHRAQAHHRHPPDDRRLASHHAVELPGFHGHPKARADLGRALHDDPQT